MARRTGQIDLFADVAVGARPSFHLLEAQLTPVMWVLSRSEFGSPLLPSPAGWQSAITTSEKPSMDAQDYRAFIALLESARSSIKAVLDDPADRSDIVPTLNRVVADLEKAIQAYRDKLNSPQP